MKVLDSKPTKSVGHFEENKFSVGCHQFLLEFCPKLIKTYNFGQNAVNTRQLKNKNKQYSENIVQNCQIFSLSFDETAIVNKRLPHHFHIYI
jgi:hypothetical protein